MVADPVVIFETVHGSRAYGLDRAGSDLDLKGVIVGPPEWYFGWSGGPEQIEHSADHVQYELRKFFRLCAGANPTVMEVLFTAPEDHVVVTTLGRRLLAERDAFLSRRVAERFGAYATAQLRRIRSHRSWLLAPPTAPPNRAAFGLPEHSVIPADQLAAATALLDDGRVAEADVSVDFIELLHRERRYKTAQQQWRQYQTWVRNRTPARAELEARYGYDTKHAMHLVRLQRMAIEILRTGEVNVRRPDRDELLAIRDGVWSYEDLEQRAEETAAAIDDAVPTFPLPDHPDEDHLDALCVEMISEALSC